VQVAASVPLQSALVSASGMHASDIWPAADGAAWQVSPLLQRARKFRFCGDCMQHALICRGNLHVAIDTIMQPWDIAALLPCIREAGGVASSAGGQRDDLVFAGSLVSACSEPVLQEVLAVLAGRS
jgi:histidinol-phosphatase